ncbi:MAG: TlpA family protein disulfide reductase [Phycisphaerales bacterium]|nr:TlpA family protein disulfide reductase [Phycisphaerales bacterium]
MHSALILAATCVLSSVALADDPDPKAILQDSAKAIAAARAITFTAQTHGVGAMATKVPAATGHVTLSRGGEKDRLGWKFVVEPVDGGLAPAAYDGTTYRIISVADRAVTEGAASDAGGMILGDTSNWTVAWLLRWPELVVGPFGPDGSGRADYNGVVTLDGVACHVIHADYSDLSDPRLYGAWWYIAESDSLPRRVEFHYYDNDHGDGFAVLSMPDIKAAEPPSDATFALAAPPGFEVKKYAPPEPRHPPGTPQRQASAVEVGKPAPAWTLKDADGKEHSLSDYKGKIVLMDFWATWCPPCRQAMPGVQAIHEKFAGKGVAVLGINAFESGDAPGFMKEQGFTYGLMMNADEVAAAYGVSGIPAFFVIGPEGELLFQGVGYSPQQEAKVEQTIEENLSRVVK